MKYIDIQKFPRRRLLNKKMNSLDTKSQLQDISLDASDTSRVGSTADTMNEKSIGTEGMSRIHDIAFIITICMAQILALAGLGQGLGSLSEIESSAC